MAATIMLTRIAAPVSMTIALKLHVARVKSQRTLFMAGMTHRGMTVAMKLRVLWVNKTDDAGALVRREGTVSVNALFHRVTLRTR